MLRSYLRFRGGSAWTVSSRLKESKVTRRDFWVGATCVVIVFVLGVLWVAAK
jgi:uncharacterized membrane protein YhaH (DUF805 family)